MSGEIKKEIELKIAYVLFLDIVGYSKLAVDDQRRFVEALNDVVHETRACREAEANARLIKLPTGDGMALVFHDRPEQPADCAFEISRALQNHPPLRLRMGIHSGPVSGLVDVNGQANVAGAGINLAQRVMDCGDGGHILLSKHAAEDLEQYSHWKPLLHDLGECRVKHGVRVRVVNLYRDELGNRARPAKFRAMRRRRMKGIALSLLFLGALAAAAVIFFHQRNSPAIPEKSIAVLPFENLSEDKGNAYFAAGIQDEILTRLANLRALKVISRTSTEKYQSHPPNLKTVGSELGVANILEGSVQKLANDVHINVQLIKATTDDHIWAQSYDRTIEHAFAVEGEVAQTVANSLKVALLPAQIEKLNALPTQNPAAYDAYLKGEYAYTQAWKNPGDYQHTLNPAIAGFQDALTLDPQFALAYAQLGEAELTKYHYGVIDGGVTRQPELLAVARSHIDQALKLQPDLAAAHVALGRWFIWGKHDHASARGELEHALALQPGLTDATLALANAGLRQGQPGNIIALTSRALEVDPRNFQLLRSLYIAYAMRRDYARSRDICARALTMDPTDGLEVDNLVQLLVQADGNLAAAGDVLNHYLAISSPEQYNSSIIARKRLLLLFYERDFVAAQTLATNLPSESWRTDWGRAQILGETQRALGDEEAACTSFQEVRTKLTTALAKDPDEPSIHAALGTADAHLGLSEEALAEARRATELRPMDVDALEGSAWVTNLARVNAILGKTDAAVDILARLLALPYTGDALSVWELKLHPDWDPLRGNPRFQKLIASPPHAQDES